MQMASMMTPEQQQQYQSLLSSSPGGLQAFQSTGGSQDYGGTLTDAAIVSMSRGQPPHIPRLNLPAALQQQQQQQQQERVYTTPFPLCISQFAHVGRETPTILLFLTVGVGAHSTGCLGKLSASSAYGHTV